MLKQQIKWILKCTTNKVLKVFMIMRRSDAFLETMFLRHLERWVSSTFLFYFHTSLIFSSLMLLVR